MKVDNSGPVFTFGEKTVQAIEEGKNRVTLLQVEELRLNKLKKSLEADLIKLEAELVSKSSLLSSKEEELGNLEVAIYEATAQLNATNKFHSETKQDIDNRLKALELVEANCNDKEKALVAKEKDLEKREAKVQKQEEKVTADLSNVKDKEAKIEAFLRTL